MEVGQNHLPFHFLIYPNLFGMFLFVWNHCRQWLLFVAYYPPQPHGQRTRLSIDGMDGLSHAYLPAIFPGYPRVVHTPTAGSHIESSLVAMPHRLCCMDDVPISIPVRLPVQHHTRHFMQCHSCPSHQHIPLRQTPDGEPTTSRMDGT